MVRGGVLIEKRDLESGLLTPLGWGQPGWHPVRNHQQEYQRCVCERRSLSARRGMRHHRGGGRYCSDRCPRAPLRHLPNGGEQAWGRVTSTPTRPCALSRFGKMGRSSSSEAAMLPITRLSVATSNLSRLARAARQIWPGSPTWPSNSSLKPTGEEHIVVTDENVRSARKPSGTPTRRTPTVMMV